MREGGRGSCELGEWFREGAVEDPPDTGYLKTADGASIAYQVCGEGPLSLVFLPEMGIPIDLLWDEPGFRRFARRICGFSRVVLTEGRGIGASGGHFLDNFVDEVKRRVK